MGRLKSIGSRVARTAEGGGWAALHRGSRHERGYGRVWEQLRKQVHGSGTLMRAPGWPSSVSRFLSQAVAAWCRSNVCVSEWMTLPAFLMRMSAV